MEFIAHKGESADAPENTMAAYRLAWERRDKAIELDVHLTKDGELICCHDHTTTATTGVPHRIADLTLAQLKELDAGRWKGAAWAGEKMPTLAEALATVPDGARCFIEVKGAPDRVPDGTIDAVKRTVEASSLRREQLLVMSFFAEALIETRQKVPWMKTHLTVPGSWSKLGGLPAVQAGQLAEAARLCQAGGLGFDYNRRIDRDYVRRIQDAGLEFYAWTVDDVEAAAQLAEAGVDGFGSNRAARLKAQLGL